MNATRAIAYVSHQEAMLIGLQSASPTPVKVAAHSHPTRQHASDVRAEHEFFSSVCDEIDRFESVLVTGGHTPLADFHHYVEKHRPLVARHIAGYEVVDHLSENQLVALGRKRFDAFERLA